MEQFDDTRCNNKIRKSVAKLRFFFPAYLWIQIGGDESKAGYTPDKCPIKKISFYL